MSDVISFRLNKDNLREAQALKVLNAWIAKGFCSGFILTTALLKLEHHGSELEMDQGNHEFGLVFDRIVQLLEIIRANPIAAQSNNLEPPALRESFLTSIKQSVKPGRNSA